MSPPGFFKAMENHFRHPLGLVRTRLNVEIIPKTVFLLYFNSKYEEMSDSLETLPNTADPSEIEILRNLKNGPRI